MLEWFVGKIVTPYNRGTSVSHLKLIPEIHWPRLDACSSDVNSLCPSKISVHLLVTGTRQLAGVFSPHRIGDYIDYIYCPMAGDFGVPICCVPHDLGALYATESANSHHHNTPALLQVMFSEPKIVLMYSRWRGFFISSISRGYLGCRTFLSLTHDT